MNKYYQRLCINIIFAFRESVDAEMLFHSIHDGIHFLAVIEFSATGSVL